MLNQSWITDVVLPTINQAVHHVWFCTVSILFQHYSLDTDCCKISHKKYSLLFLFLIYLRQLINNYTIKFLYMIIFYLFCCDLNLYFLLITETSSCKFQVTHGLSIMIQLSVHYTQQWLTHMNSCTQRSTWLRDCGMRNAYSSNWEQCQLWTEVISVN
jgi:hypothetical protein